MSLATSARPRAVTAALLLLLALGIGSLPPISASAADASPPEPTTAQPDWTVTATTDPRTGGPVWRVTWRPSEQIVVRAQRPVITSDGRPVGFAVEAPDLWSISATTTDPRLVFGGPRFALTYGGHEVGAAPPPTLTEPPGDPAGLATAPRPPLLDVDPGRRGRFETRTASYNLGRQALTVPALDHPIEMAGQVYWPRNAQGPRPVVVFLHGRHHTCFDGKFTSMQWPCPRGTSPVPSHRGYGRPAQILASHGYVVISISANGVNAQDGALLDSGATARAQVIRAHLRQWRSWASEGGAPFGSAFVGRLDFGRVGLMGHSRGGEGVVAAALANAASDRPFGIRAVLPLAPTSFQRRSLPGVAMSVVLPYCDGDVYGLDGQRYFDDARYALRNDPAPKSAVLVMGANHNFFNTEWTPSTTTTTAVDDWTDLWGTRYRTCNPGAKSRLSAREQRAVGNAYIAGFFRLHLGREKALRGLLDGSGRRAESAGAADVRVAAQSPERQLLNRLADRSTVRAGGLQAQVCAGADYGWFASGKPACVIHPDQAQVPHWGPTAVMPKTSTRRVLSLRWDDRGDTLTVPIRPGKRNLSAMHALTLHAATDPAVGTADLRIRLTDSAGRHQSVLVSEVSRALTRPPGVNPPLPRTILSNIYIPLSRFDRIDLTRVTSVRLVAATVSGHVWLSDLSAQRAAIGRSMLHDLPVLSMGDVSVREGDSGTTLARFTLSSSKVLDRAVSVYAQATRTVLTDEDSTFIPMRMARRVTVPAGGRQQVVDVPVPTNTVDDFDMDFIVSLSKTRDAIVSDWFARGRVRDDDPTPTLTISSDSAMEGSSNLRFKYALSAPSGKPIVVSGVPNPGTAVAGEDYEDLWILFSEPRPGRTYGSLLLPVLDDTVAEPTETMTVDVQVGNATLVGPTSLTGTIRDDD